MSAVNITNWEAARFASPHDDEPNETPCESCDALRIELARAHALLRTIRRLESKPSKRETIEDSPETLEAVGHAVFVATIRARIDLYLASAANVRS